MAKYELGIFEDKINNKNYHLFFRLGYGDNKNVIYVGNYTYGNLFSYKIDNIENIRLIMKRKNHKGFSVDLYIPKQKGDLKSILEMILKPMGCKIMDLKFNSRKQITNLLVKNAVIKKLNGNGDDEW